VGAGGKKVSRFRGRALGIALLTVLATVAMFPGGAAAKQGQRGLFDSRYCEIFELRGAIPNAKVVVFNTIGLNKCPAAKWTAIDPTQLATDLGVPLVVLNGPRHWVFDSASGRIGKPRTIAGIRMRKVASIPIVSPAELVQTPYTERTIERHNTWRWKRGRRIYELISPDGAKYVMQAFSQQRDSDLAVQDLRSLGGRLNLPAGWRYRSHRLSHRLVMRARGQATILQDDLLDTYQRLP
jgi:hypothetical protein